MNQKESIRLKLLAKVHIAKKALGMEDDGYRDFLQAQTGKRSAGLLNEIELDKVLAQMKRLEETQIPSDFDYDIVSGLSREITQKLNTVRPETLAQASRIPGVTPAAVQLVMITIRKNAMTKKSA